MTLSYTTVNFVTITSFMRYFTLIYGLEVDTTTLINVVPLLSSLFICVESYDTENQE